MTIEQQKKKLDSDIIAHSMDRIKQQRLLLAAPKPQARPPVSFQEGQSLLYAMGHQDIIEAAGCCVIGGGE